MARKKTKQEKLLEKEEEKRKKRIMKEKTKQYDGGFFARCVAILVGFVLGIVGTIGGIVGGGYYIASQKTIKETASLAGGFDITKYLSEEYADKTIMQFINSIGEIGTKLSGGTASLATVAEISPYANDLADKLVSKLADLGLEIDGEELKTTAFSAYGEFLQTSLQKTKLAKFIGAQPDNTLMGLLCFGEEGADYIKNEDGSLTWLGDSHELTVGDFMDNGSTSDTFNRLSLKAVMETTGSVNLNDSITRTLVYGTKGVDYTVETVDEGGAQTEKITMLPLVYSYEDDGLGTYTLKDDSGEVVDSALYAVDSGTGVIALYKTAPAAGETPEISAYLKKNELEGKYYAYCSVEDAATETNKILHKPTSLGDLLKGNFSKTFESLQLCELLNVTHESEGALLALAYGNKGEDYTVTDGKIVMLGNAQPRTIADLKNDTSLFSNLRLADVLKIAPNDGSSNETMVTLAYGKEGKNYSLKGDEITWLPKEYVEKEVEGELTLFDDAGNDVGADKTDGVWKWTNDGKTYQTKSVAEVRIGAGETGADEVKGTHTFYAYEVTDGVASETPVTYAPRTINDLKTLDTQELIGGMTLESLLKIDVNTSDGVLTSLAYGKEGVTYEVVTEGEGKKSVSMKKIAYTFDGSGWKDENGKVITPVGSFSDGATGATYEFIRTENGVPYYAYATSDSAAGAYPPAYPLYDAHGKELKFEKRSVSALKSENATEVFNSVELRHVIAEDKNDKINLYLLYGKENVGYEIVDGNVVLRSAPHTIGDLRASGENSLITKMRNDLTIGDILGNEAVSNNRILKHLAGSTLNSLSGDINGLKIVNVFDTDIYRVDEGTGEFILDDENNKIMNPEWKYLLTNSDKKPEEYTINDMSSLTSNMKKNIANASIFNLNKDFGLGIDDTTNSSFPNMPLDNSKLQDLVDNHKMTGERMAALNEKKVGDLTIKELFDYIPTMFP